jgi:diguanylate cyclase (GGDEF)-like protein
MEEKRDTNTVPRGLPINTLLVLSFVVVALLPISILGFKIYDAAWEDAWREVKEKHQSLAENLAAPIDRYLNDRRIALSLLRQRLAQDDQATASQTSLILADGLNYLSGFRAIFLLDAQRRLVNFASSYSLESGHFDKQRLGNDDFLDLALRSGKTIVSPVIVNPYTGKTTLYIATTLSDDVQRSGRLLVGELKKQDIEVMRGGIRFGQQGHAAIVDLLGQVIVHPNTAWMDDGIKDLAHLSIVQDMMAGKTGVTEFYSPFTQQDMVAGYTTVPRFGWGIMVPQPKAEVEAQVQRVLYAELTWGLIGLALALIVALALARWITRPINLLATAGQQLHTSQFQSGLPNIQHYAPREIQQLNTALGGAVNELIASRTELAALNRSLQERVADATTELREANSQLEQLAKRDHLTQLANRRHFELAMANLATRRQGDQQDVCLLLLDVDKFKAINDQYGHAAGDAVLVQIGNILQQGLRRSDLAARYAGDEFVVLMRADLETGRQRAVQLREAIDRHLFQYEDQTLHATVSIGLASYDIGNNDDDVDIEEILRQVDEAMYQAKHLGRNRIAEASISQAG